MAAAALSMKTCEAATIPLQLSVLANWGIAEITTGEGTGMAAAALSIKAFEAATIPLQLSVLANWGIAGITTGEGTGMAAAARSVETLGTVCAAATIPLPCSLFPVPCSLFPVPSLDNSPLVQPGKLC